jgi:flavin-dependent dehydrogenase
MATYRLKNNELPMDDAWDVVIAGGGPSGCAAAIAAAREGARTLLVEGTGMLGGRDSDRQQGGRAGCGD